MVQPVTYLELYLRRLEVLRKLYNQQHGDVADHGIGEPGVTSKDCSAAAGRRSSACYSDSTSRRRDSTSPQEPQSPCEQGLNSSGLISAHVPERIDTRNQDGPFLVTAVNYSGSSIPASPSAVKRRRKHSVMDHLTARRSKIPARPVPYGIAMVRSHPLPFGVIKQFAADENSLQGRSQSPGGWRDNCWLSF